jgi:hypothetical protein
MPNATFKMNGTTAMSKSGTDISIASGVTVPAAGVTGTLGSGVTFPAGHVLATALLQDQKAYNVNSGTSSALNTRVLTTEVFDDGNIVTLSSNQFTLGAGTYIIQAQSSHMASVQGRHVLAIYNTTDSTYDINGLNNWNLAGGDCIYGKISPSGTKVYELRSYVAESGRSDGLGVSHNYSAFGYSVYSQVLIQKIMA